VASAVSQSSTCATVAGHVLGMAESGAMQSAWEVGPSTVTVPPSHVEVFFFPYPPSNEAIQSHSCPASADERLTTVFDPATPERPAPPPLDEDEHPNAATASTHVVAKRGFMMPRIRRSRPGAS
jgi:hypothetical protein